MLWSYKTLGNVVICLLLLSGCTVVSGSTVFTTTDLCTTGQILAPQNASFYLTVSSSEHFDTPRQSSYVAILEVTRNNSSLALLTPQGLRLASVMSDLKGPDLRVELSPLTMMSGETRYLVDAELLKYLYQTIIFSLYPLDALGQALDSCELNLLQHPSGCQSLWHNDSLYSLVCRSVGIDNTIVAIAPNRSIVLELEAISTK